MQQDSGIDSSSVSFCLSFNSYTDDKLVDIADRVRQDEQQRNGNDDVGNSEEEDFEFDVSVRDGCELVIDGQIRPVFPVFNRDLLLNNDEDGYDDQLGSEQNLLVPLRNLFIQDRDGPLSSSSSEADELEGVPEETYCVWTPNKKPVESSPNRCKKSNSTGSSSSSKRWFKFRNLHKRSNSDGKESYIFLHKPKINADSKSKQGASEVKAAHSTGKVKVASAHEMFYMQNRAVKQSDKKRSYLPYKQDLFGFFASNVSSLGKTFPPF